MKTAILLYEASQVDELPKILEDAGEYDLLVMSADLEFLLEEKGISFVSVRDFRGVSTPDRLILARNIGEKIMYHSALSFLQYREINIARLYRAALQYYLAKLLYHLDIVSNILSKGKYSRIRVYTPAYMPGPAAAVLESHSINVLPDAVKLVAQKYSVSVEILEHVRSPRTDPSRLKRYISIAMLSVFNTLVRYFVPKKKIHILASELWKNIECLFEELPDTELILLDRAEAKTMGLGAIFRHRTQFLHLDDYVSFNKDKEIKKLVQGFGTALEGALAQQKDILDVEFLNIPLSPVLLGVLKQIVTIGAERTMREIEGAYKVMETSKPNMVLVRAGISAQTHFGVLCEVARIKKIPSVEIQHGILSVFEGDFTYDPSSEYIAEYGSLVHTQLASHNFAPRSTFLDIGSPRFDEYENLEHLSSSSGEVHVLHIGPQLTPGEWNDSYDVLDYFNSTAQALRGFPNVHVTIKLRASRIGEKFFRKAILRSYGDIVTTIAIFEPLQDLLKQTDLVISCHSTAYLEALIAGKPVLIDTALPIYKALAEADLTPFREAKALITVETVTEFQNVLRILISSKEDRALSGKRGQEFITNNFLLDGKSSTRLANEIRKLVSR